MWVCHIPSFHVLGTSVQIHVSAGSPCWPHIRPGGLSSSPISVNSTLEQACSWRAQCCATVPAKAAAPRWWTRPQRPASSALLSAEHRSYQRCLKSQCTHSSQSLARAGDLSFPGHPPGGAPVCQLCCGIPPGGLLVPQHPPRCPQAPEGSSKAPRGPPWPVLDRSAPHDPQQLAGGLQPMTGVVSARDAWSALPLVTCAAWGPRRLCHVCE